MSDISNNNSNSSLHSSNADNINVLEYCAEFILENMEENDVEMLEAVDQDEPVENIINIQHISHNNNPSGVTIQSINSRISNWSNRYRYIPMINNFIIQNNDNLDDAVSRAANGLISRSFIEDSPKYKNVLSEKGKSIIKFIKFSSEKFPHQSICPITQEKFEKDQNVALLPCGHIFEEGAVMKWLQDENASCPSCRFKLDSVEEEIKKDNVSDVRFTINNLLNFIDRREQQREEEDVQRAIIASLRDINGADF